MIKEMILALIAGLIVGFVFSWIKLPLPAPPAFAGVVGIAGVYLGFRLYEWVKPLIDKVF